MLQGNINPSHLTRAKKIGLRNHSFVLPEKNIEKYGTQNSTGELMIIFPNQNYVIVYSHHPPNS